MTTTFGDKIGIDAATPGGSDGTWGTEYGAAFTVLDELVYAPREDRNLAIIGGGKIAWDGSDLSFTASIEVHNHVTAFKNSITVAASPITIDAAGKVAYVVINRKPSSDNNVVSATVVAAGSLPNGVTDGVSGQIVLAYRTSEGTIIIPWARRELLSGDHWQFGAALSFYERMATLKKPQYTYNAADLSQIQVLTSATKPAVVMIDGKLYALSSTATMDLDTSGRGGLDTSTKAANTVYYLYAIPPTSGRAFDLVCSVTGPASGGPTGFSSWSYLGAFQTDASSDVLPFEIVNGLFRFQKGSFAIASSITSTSFASATVKKPETTDLAYLRISATTTGSLNSGRIMISEDGTNVRLTFTALADGIGTRLHTYMFWFSISDASDLIHHKWNENPSSDAYDINVSGWIEHPEAWQ